MHKAVLADGRQVALKIQKPGVDTVMQTDLGVLHSVFWVLEKAVPSLKAANLAPIIDEMRARMLAEADFLAESHHIDKFLAHLHQVGNTSDRTQGTSSIIHQKVLVMDLLIGKSLVDESLVWDGTAGKDSKKS